MFEIRGLGNARTIITNANEREILLAPGQKLRILEVRHNVTVGDDTIGQWVVGVIE